jgi:hypothetical protein
MERPLVPQERPYRACTMNGPSWSIANIHAA